MEQVSIDCGDLIVAGVWRQQDCCPRCHVGRCRDLFDGIDDDLHAHICCRAGLAVHRDVLARVAALKGGGLPHTQAT